MIKNRSEISSSVVSLWEKIKNCEGCSDVSKMNELRLEIIGLLRDVVDFYDENNCFDLWEKYCISDALHRLRLHITADNGTTEISWLRSTLRCLENSATDKSARNDAGLDKKKDSENIEKLTKEDFFKSLDELEQLIKHCK